MCFNLFTFTRIMQQRTFHNNSKTYRFEMAGLLNLVLNEVKKKLCEQVKKKSQIYSNYRIRDTFLFPTKGARNNKERNNLYKVMNSNSISLTKKNSRGKCRRNLWNLRRINIFLFSSSQPPWEFYKHTRDMYWHHSYE